MTAMTPLNPTPIPEIPLPQAPLERVIGQARFPTILAIHQPEKVAGLQEMLRETYPNLSREEVHRIEFGSDETPNVHKEIIWRFADKAKKPNWRVSLGINFVALETSSYDSRDNFLNRLHAAFSAVEQVFGPASATRLGLRYIDRLVDDAARRVDELIHPEVLGIAQPSDNLDSTLRESVLHQMTETQFQARNDVFVQGRWGALNKNMTYDRNALEPIGNPSWVLDLDMFTTKPQPFISENLLTTTTDFAECLYWVFRQMVTVEFLKFYGGKP